MIDIAEWLPDQPIYKGGAGEALNVVPRARSYGPLPSFVSYSDSLSARCQGAAAFRGESIGRFAGDATKLYRISGTSWSDASALGVTYATPPDGQWNFAQFGNLVVAVNGVDSPQKINGENDTRFSALAGSPPVAKYIAIVRDFVFLGNLAGAPQSVRWSALNNAESWEIQVDEADIQPIPDGGNVQGIVGGEIGIVFSEDAINLFTYVGGDFIFQRDKVTNEIGATISGSIAAFASQTFFLHRTGFYSFTSGGGLQQIGAERVNNYFWTNLNGSYQHRVTSAIDPENNLYAISFPNQQSSDGTPNEILFYNWITNKWSHAMPGSHELIHSSISSMQLSLEDIGAIYSDIDTLPYSLDSDFWKGVGNLYLGSFDATHKATFMNGPSLPATIDTTEIQFSNGQRSYVREARPMIEAINANITLAVGTRNKLDEQVLWSQQMQESLNGKINIRSNARYHRFRLRTQTGDQWTHILGIDDPIFEPVGGR